MLHMMIPRSTGYRNCPLLAVFCLSLNVENAPKLTMAISPD